MSHVPPEFLSYEDLRHRADAFLARYHPSGAIPVPIEHIAEVQLGIDIVPVPGLREILQSDDYGVESYITSNLKEIHVDEWVWRHRYNRYRFSIAHEIGHAVLHGELYQSATFNSIESWKAFSDAIPGDDHSWYEWQAYAFAGLILVPAGPLREAVGRHVARVTERISQEGIPLARVWDTVWDIILEEVAHEFEVSVDVIQKRVDKDGLRDEFPPGKCR